MYICFDGEQGSPGFNAVEQETTVFPGDLEVHGNHGRKPLSKFWEGGFHHPDD